MYTLDVTPKFGDTSSLSAQLAALVASDEATNDCMMVYDFVAAQDMLTSTCYEPMMSIKPT